MQHNPAEHLKPHWWKPGQAPRSRGTTGRRFLKSSTILKEIAGKTVEEVFGSAALQNASPKLRKKIIGQVLTERLIATALGFGFEAGVDADKRAQLSFAAMKLCFKLGDNGPEVEIIQSAHRPPIVDAAAREAHHNDILRRYIKKRYGVTLPDMG